MGCAKPMLKFIRRCCALRDEPFAISAKNAMLYRLLNIWELDAASR